MAMDEESAGLLTSEPSSGGRPGEQRAERRDGLSARARARAAIRLAGAGLLLSGLVFPLTPAAAQGSSPIVTLPLYDSGGTGSFYRLSLGTGDGHLIDRLERDPPRGRIRPLGHNLFQEIGRPVDQAAFAGEIQLGPIRAGTGGVEAVLFAETSTGYVAFFDQVLRGNRLGRISVAIGRPFGPLASMDGNYALLMRRDGAGRTVGAYLYHATTGRGLYYPGLRKLEVDAEAVATSDLPRLSGRVAAAPIQSSREETTGYLVADGGSGELHFLDLSSRAPERVTIRKSPVGLPDVLSAAGPHSTPQRFVVVPILAADDSTRQVFVLDVSSGEMAVLDNVTGPGATPVPRKASPNLYDALGGEAGSDPRVVAAVPALAGSGQTVGIWLVDSLSGSLVYVGNPGSAAGMTVRRADTGR